jgi:hypothetical protein
MRKYYIGYAFSHGGVIVDGPKHVQSGKSIEAKWKVLCPNCKTETWKFSNTLTGLKFPCKKCYDNSMKRTDEFPAVKKAFISLRNNAKVRGVIVSIDEDTFYSIASNPCTYCGTDPVEKMPPKKWQKSVFLHGIDRVDNTLGYTKENSCSCCEQCNWAKKDLTLEKWNLWIDRLIEKRM